MFICFSISIILTILCSFAYADDVPKPVAVENKNEVFLNDDTVHTWTSPAFPNAYPSQNQTLIIKCDAGFSVSITIETLDLDGGSGDFLVAKSGTTLDSDVKGKVFTYKLKNKKTYIVNTNSVFLSLQVHGKNDLRKTGFSLSYKRIGEIKSPTTEPPTTPWPNPSEDDLVYVVVYVSGKTIVEFNSAKVQTEFKMSVSQMAIEYCKSNNILLVKEITDENVQIHYLTQCPYSWPERETCTKIRFAVPIHVAENGTWSGYQLTAFHLSQMWDDLGNKYLEQYGMTIYTQPGNKSTMKWWIIILCSMIVLFSVVLYLLKVFGANIPKRDFKKNKMNGTNTLPGYIHSSTLTINPYPYSQSTPPIFDNYDYSYKQYNSDSDEDDVYPTKKPNESYT